MMMTNGFVVWFTGLPCSGKSTLAEALKERLGDRNYKYGSPSYVRILDGDFLRKGICADLGFSRKDRDENVRRVALMAAELADAGAIVLVALVSPYRTARDNAREIIGPDRFVEIFVDCGLQECINRDKKGMYHKAIRGELARFTGVDDPYESPITPEIHLRTDMSTVEACVDAIFVCLQGRNFI